MRCLPWLFVLLAGFVSAQSNEPVVEMPAYPVREQMVLRPPESWRHAQAGEVEVLSSASDARTAEFAERFVRFQTLFRELLPPVKGLTALPIAIVLCDREGEFDQLVPAQVRPAGNVATTSYFAADTDQAAIVFDAQAKQLALQTPGQSTNELLAGNGAESTDDSGTADDNSGFVTVDPEQMFTREYVHFQLSRFSPRLPAWIAEGFAQLYSHLSIGEKDFEFNGMDAALIRFFKQRRLLPLDRLFAVSYDSQEFLQPVNSVFANESLAFVHLCLYGRNGQLQKPFSEFMRRASREPVTEKMFKEIFHESYTSMAIAIRNHVEGTSFKSGKLALPVALPTVKVVAREATDTEVGRIKGDALRLAGRAGAARSELLSPYLRGHGDARLLAAIGFLDRSEQNDPIAQKYFALSTKAGVSMPGPYVYLAESRLAGLTALGAPPLSAPAANELLAFLRSASYLQPPRADIYRLKSEVWLHTAATPTASDLDGLTDAVRVFPRDLALVYAVARVKLRAGQTAEAAPLVDLGLRTARTDDVRQQFAALKSGLPH